jgi:hypothetical protein
MAHDRICVWLALPSHDWPPDHYCLLGLRPGEADPARIEHRVHQRLETVRRYQLQDPDQATEAMNQIAQAFVCLTDPAAKKAYDAKLFGKESAPPATSSEPEELPTESEDHQEASLSQDPLAWLYGPGSGSSATVASFSVVTPLQSDTEKGQSSRKFERVPAGLPGNDLPDVVMEAARSSEAARLGLGTKRAMYFRIARTRQLLHAWEKAGTYIGNPSRRLTKPAEATDLIYWMSEIRTLLRSFPPLLGDAGQPGYLVAVLAQQQVIVPTFQTLLPSQREALARDWRTGIRLLLEHRQFLREQLRKHRRRGPLGRAVSAVRHLVNHYPGAVLLTLGVVALLLALIQSLLP